MAVFVLAIFPGSVGIAAETEDVHIVTAGGIDRLETLTVRYSTDEEPTLYSSTAQPLHLSDGGLATYSDLAILPGGHFLMASHSEESVLHFDDKGQQIEALGHTNLPVESAVVAGFLAPDEPDLLLLSHDKPGRIRLFDELDGEARWTLTFNRDDESAHIARSVALPDDRIATAARWPELSLSAVEIASIDDPGHIHRIVWSRFHGEAVDDDPVIDGLHPVRDLMAGLDGYLLVTSAHQIAIVDPDDGALWAVSTGDDPALGGEFESARWLDSGLIVAATRQPGLWTQPHTHHGVHLIDPDADVPLLDSRTGFSAAPIALDSARGIGATGTRHYYADAFDDDGSPPSVLAISQGPTLDPPDPRRDATTSLSFAVENNSDDPVTLRRLQFLIGDIPCDELDDAHRLESTLWSDDALPSLEPGDTWEVDDQELSTESLPVAHHCGRIGAVARDGSVHFIGDPVDFQIRSPDGHGPVIVDELQTHDDETPAGDPGLSSDEPPPGCACSTHSSPSSLLFFLFLILGTAAKRLV